jgi:hypothetical protein
MNQNKKLFYFLAFFGGLSLILCILMMTNIIYALVDKQYHLFILINPAITGMLFVACLLVGIFSWVFMVDVYSIFYKEKSLS